jgi:hypothetical protein
MKGQSTLKINHDSGRIELMRANQGLNHDLDDSQSSGRSEVGENEGQTKYLTTNVLAPEK